MEMLLALQILFLIIQFLAFFWLVSAFISGMISAAHGVPYVPVPQSSVRKLLTFGQVRAEDILYDLGSGDGRIILSARRDFHVRRVIGYEVAPWPYWKSRFLIKLSGVSGIELRKKSFFKSNIADATYVYLYLFPKLVDQLAEKFAHELQSGTRVMSVSFPIDTARHPKFQLKKEEKIGTLTAYLYEKI